VPEDRRLALVRDRDGRRAPSRRRRRGADATPDLLRVVLDPPRPRELLRKLLVPAADDAQLVVERQTGGARRPLVDGEDHACRETRSMALGPPRSRVGEP